MIKMNEQEKRAYLAGIIDADGSIMYTRTAVDKRRNKKYFRVMLRVANNDPKLIEWIRANFPGNWYIEKKTGRGENHENAYIINLHNSQAVSLIEKVEPYLLIKKSQSKLARLAGYFHSLQRGKPGLKDPLPPIRERLHEIMGGLNYRGKNSMAIRKQWGELLETLFTTRAISSQVG